ncbi:MAG: hypothetical protein A2541_01075 [Candidatus Taylorbacteria bacterium RIFOXYD2_FULL_36_9]|uniref:Uncharacterized protein n=1 Tax=Candidatus Taylorbacteria bacterium RIFOXYD2_FULL_36_9 TaxID=1802338 RepID=A0A1G2PF72_9BACT|nr:MAG: hypothetical protein A2541_01075 [Candidatus Taylorbacteria bacterium RIFOXYD2_FULL_36_9]
MKKVVKIIAGSVWALPVLALAQNLGGNSSYFGRLIGQAKSLLDQLVVFLIALAVVWFIYNVIRYTMTTDMTKKDMAKDQMIWGIVAIAVIVSIWGLVSLLQNIFGVRTTSIDGVGGLLPSN